jgi:hypothetical protein
VEYKDFSSVRVPTQDMMYPKRRFKVMVFAHSVQRTNNALTNLGRIKASTFSSVTPNETSVKNVSSEETHYGILTFQMRIKILQAKVLVLCLGYRYFHST